MLYDEQSRPVTLVGLSEAAQILGWDKRKLATYIKRGKFITPIQRLASGPIWTEKQVMEWMGH